MSKKHNILLIQFPLKGLIDRSMIDEDRHVVYPLGISYVASVLGEHNVALFDPNTAKDHSGELSSLIEKIKPDVIGLSIRVLINLQKNKDILASIRSYVQYIKALSPHSTICAGGSGFSLYACKIMKEIEDIDFGVFLSGEQSFLELLDHLDSPEKVKGIYYRKNGVVFFSGEREKTNFGNFFIPRRDLLDLKKYDPYPFSIGVRTKIGCGFHCIHCNYIFLNGNSLYLRPPEEVVDEIEQLQRSRHE